MPYIESNESFSRFTGFLVTFGLRVGKQHVHQARTACIRCAATLKTTAQQCTNSVNKYMPSVDDMRPRKR
eukprot:6208562-Pleurochrysis_carterae.AAC.2